MEFWKKKMNKYNRKRRGETEREGEGSVMEKKKKNNNKNRKHKKPRLVRTGLDIFADWSQGHKIVFIRFVIIYCSDNKTQENIQQFYNVLVPSHFYF